MVFQRVFQYVSEYIGEIKEISVREKKELRALIAESHQSVEIDPSMLTGEAITGSNCH